MEGVEDVRSWIKLNTRQRIRKNFYAMFNIT
jgi:hypothetical protein